MWLLSLSLNRAGSHYGESMLCPPWLDATILEPSFSTAEELRIFEIDRGRLISAREHYPFLNDARKNYEQQPLSGS